VSAADLVISLTEAGCALWIASDKLCFRAPKGVVSEERRGELVAVREAAIAVLRAGVALPADRPAWSQDLQAEFEERAGLLEFEGGLDRSRAEHEAERLVRVDHARRALARLRFVVTPTVAVAGHGPGSGPRR
jgi:hypothetical protein